MGFPLKVILVSLCGCFANASSLPRRLGLINTTNPGFTNLFEHANPSLATDRYTFLFSSFQPIPFENDFTKSILHIGQYLGDLDRTDVREISNKPFFPREPSQIPLHVFGHEAVLQADGFLFPGKTDGSLKVIDVRDWNSPVTYDITSDPSGNTFEWFYHRALWFDIDQDGRFDAITNRANRNLDTGVLVSEFLWFKQPDSSAPLEQRWESTVIHSNLSDTFLHTARLSTGNSTFQTIVTVGFFSRKLLIHWSTASDGSWANPENIAWREIDSGCRFFLVEVVDINADGKVDILATCNEPKNGSLIAYEIPEDFRTGKFKKHVLKSGFDVIDAAPHTGTPGGALVLYPRVNDTSGKPLIALSGQFSGFAFILTARSQDPERWDYDMEVLLNEGDLNIVGTMSAADVDGDGFTELFAPSYYLDRIHVFTFSPSPTVTSDL